MHKIILFLEKKINKICVPTLLKIFQPEIHFLIWPYYLIKISMHFELYLVIFAKKSVIVVLELSNEFG